nr:hypothetical protein BaRGS_029595 [Batillaria attramentaria]
MWWSRLLLVVTAVTSVTSYYFQTGYSHHYTYWARNSILGQRNVTTVVKFHIDHLNETEGGLRLHSLTVDSLVQFLENGVLMQNPAGWDLKKAFLFVTDAKGSVTLVHCHPKDRDELLVIKKAMVSVFSVHVKTLDYDHQGTLHKAEALDHVLLKDKKGRTYKRYPRHRSSGSGQTETGREKKVVKLKIADVQQNITRNLECLRRFPEPDDANRTVCSNELRLVLKKLNTEDYQRFAESFLSKRCSVQSSECEDERLVILDLVARMGDDGFDKFAYVGFR